MSHVRAAQALTILQQNDYVAPENVSRIVTERRNHSLQIENQGEQQIAAELLDLLIKTSSKINTLSHKPKVWESVKLSAVEIEQKL